MAYDAVWEMISAAPACTSEDKAPPWWRDVSITSP